MKKKLFDNKEDDISCASCLLILIMFIGLTFAIPGIEMWLWNWVAVDIFSAPVIGYWEMFGLNLLLGLLVRRGSITTSWKD